MTMPATTARDLRSLLALARQLRALSGEPMAEADRTLYLTAATALEARARRLAASLSGPEHDLPDSHAPLNLLV